MAGPGLTASFWRGDDSASSHQKQERVFRHAYRGVDGDDRMEGELSESALYFRRLGCECRLFHPHAGH